MPDATIATRIARVLIPLAPGCEEIEAVTLIDILRRAGIEVVAAGLGEGPVRGSHGIALLPDCTLDEARQGESRHFDMIALPGGMPGMTHLKNDPRIIALLKEMAAAGQYTAA